MTIRIPSYLRGLLLGLFAALGPLPAQDDPSLADIKAELNEPIHLLFDGGNRQTGRVVKWDGEEMRLSVDLGAGSAEMTFPAESIKEIAFPGGQYTSLLHQWMQTPDRQEDAMELFRAFYRQRNPYLDLLDRNDFNLFFNYAKFALEQDVPLRAVAIIETIRPYIEDADRLRELDDAILMGFYLGGMRERAETQARRLIKDSQPYGDSAMPWRILAELHFEAEHYEKAFWTALQPVAFSNRMPMAELDACYALAVAAADELRLKEDARRLAHEMHRRGFAWPESVPAIRDRVPEAYSEIEESAEEPDEDDAPTDEEELEPLETPAPVDPVESLPTRLNL